MTFSLHIPRICSDQVLVIYTSAGRQALPQYEYLLAVLDVLDSALFRSDFGNTGNSSAVETVFCL